jgi:pilus assembly protein FimV
MINKTFSSVAVIIALGIITPMQANAFGLGKLELSSALNEPFRAKIPVTALREDEEGNLQVRLATSNEFARAGIERSHYLTQLVFNVVEHSNGATIEVSSQQPIKEPFVDFLLTATTGEGRLIREYTVLLDPPKTVFVKPSKAVAPTQAKKVSPSSSGKTTYNYPESTYQAPSYYSGNTYGPTKRDDTLWDIALATKPSSSVSVHQMMMALLDANPSAFIKNNINNLKTGQTLTIPSVDEISRLSHRQAVARVSEQWQQWKNANKVVAQVQQQSQPNVTNNDGEILQNGEHSSSGGNDARLQLVVDSEDTPTGSDELTPLGSDALTKLRDQLTLAQETIEGQEQENIDFKARMDAMEKQLEIMRKIIMVKDADLARLQGMLGEEEKVDLASDDLPDEMQTALDESKTDDTEITNDSQETLDGAIDELLDDSGELVTALDSNNDSTAVAFSSVERVVDEAAVAAAAQSAREEAEYSGNNVFAGPDLTPAVVEDTIVEFAESNAFDDSASLSNDLLQEYRVLDEQAVALAAQAAKEEAAFSNNTILPEVDKNIPADEMTAELETLPSDETVVESLETTDVIVAPANSENTKAGFLDTIKAFITENKIPVLGGLVALFLGLLAWLFARRRNQDEYEWVDTESLEDGATSDEEPANVEEEQITDNASSEVVVEASESVDDLLNKAEMSIAYGEYDEAHAIVEKARLQQPNNKAVALTLVALAYHQKQTDKFNGLVANIDIDKDSTDWKEIATWGRELDPENALYHQEISEDLNVAESLEESIEDVSTDLETAIILDKSDDEVNEIDLSDSFVDQKEEEPVESDIDTPLSFDSDFDLEKLPDVEDDTSLEFDTPLTLDIETNEDNETILTDSLDEDIDVVIDTSDLPEEVAEELETEIEELAEEIPELEIESLTETTEQLEELAENSTEILSEIEVESVTEVVEKVEEFDIGADDLEFDIGDFDEVDEAETKLDLAAAYVDMGDPDGAKNILNEVLEEGNDDQKSRAQDLLNNLA